MSILKITNPIGRNKRYISNNHKLFFSYDDENNIIEWKYRICIDTVNLKAYLKQKELAEILESFNYRTEHITDEIKRYHINLIVPFGVYIILEPHNKLNATIQLKSKFTNNRIGNSSIVLDILNRHQWFIRRIDYAIDYVTPYRLSMAFKRNGNQRKKNYETGENIGSSANPKAKVLVSHYDRYENNSKLETEFINRFEVKIMFQIKERVTFINLDHSVIARRLKEELFIPHIFFNNLSKKEKYLLKQAKKEDNENYLKETLTQPEYSKLRSNFKMYRDEIEDYYLNNSHLVYDFLLPKGTDA